MMCWHASAGWQTVLLIDVQSRSLEKRCRGSNSCLLRSVHLRPYTRTTLAGPAADHQIDLVLREVHPAALNQTWVGDITYICTRTAGRTWRRWSTATPARSWVGPSLTTCAPSRPSMPSTWRSKSEATSRRHLPLQHDAVAGSFFSTIKKEVVHPQPSPTLARLSTAVFDYIETYYSRKRCHSILAHLTPEKYEREFDKETSKQDDPMPAKAGPSQD